MAIDKERAAQPSLAEEEAGADGGTNSGLETGQAEWVNHEAAAIVEEPQEVGEISPAEKAGRDIGAVARWWRIPPAFRYYLSLEVALYVLIIGLATFLRFFNLDAQALHHDEGVHAFYSWRYFDGQGYEQEPWKHGPFLYHITAAVFWLFGDTIYNTRISTALFGVLTCLLPLFLRKELGRWGALTATFLLTISPMFLYYSRFLREDIFVAFATLALFIGLVRFVDQPSAKWWYATLLALGLLFCTKEVSFFYLALFGGFLVVWLCWQLAPRLILILGGYTLAAAFIFFFVLKIYPPPPIPYDQITGNQIGQYISQLTGHPIFFTFWILLFGGLAVFWFAFAEVARSRRRFMQHQGWATGETRATTALFAPYRQPGTVAYAVGWLGRHQKVMWIGLGLGFAFYFVFFTGFFSNIPEGSVGLVSGLWYWMAQQGVARGNQPWFYYLFMLPLYEPLALAFGTLASGLILYRAVRYGFRRRIRPAFTNLPATAPTAQSAADSQDDELDDLNVTTDEQQDNSKLAPQGYSSSKTQNLKLPKGNALWPGLRRREPHPYFVPLLMVVWAWGSLALYTWASEKMPWLTVQLTLPFIILTAWLMQRVWRGIEEFFIGRKHREVVLWGIRANAFFWVLVGGLSATVFLMYMTLLNLTSVEMKINTSGGTFDWLLFWIPPVIAILFFTAIFSFIGLKITLKATLAVAFVFLTYYLIHTGFGYAFDHGDVALEPGVYTQTTPDTYRVIKELYTVYSVMPQRQDTPVLYDDDMRTPLDFYLRHYTNKRSTADFKDLSPNSGTGLTFNDYPVIMITDPKVATLDDNQRKILNDNFISRHYTFHYWFEEGQYRNFDKTDSVEISTLQGKPSKAAVKDANNQVVLNKDETMTTEKLQQLAGMAGVLDKVYNANGGNASLLHLQQAGQSLYQLRTPGDFSRLWRYVIYREQFQPLGRREFVLYIRKDIAGKWRQFADLVDYPISGQGK